MRRTIAILALLVAIAPAQDKPTSILDANEELVYELEGMCETQRIAITHYAVEQAVDVYDENFRGDVYFDDSPWTVDRQLPNVAISTRKANPQPQTRVSLAGQLRAFLAQFDSIDAITYKFDGADYGATNDDASGLMKVTFVGRKAGVPCEVYERGKTVFRRKGGIWRIASIERDQSRRKQAATRVFVDVARQIGLDIAPGLKCYGCAYDTTRACGGIAAADYDGDGDVDLYITRVGQSLLMRNKGDGTFENATAGSGLERRGREAGAIWIDYDNDGRLDLFVTARSAENDPPEMSGVTMYRNLADGRFENVTVKVLGRRFNAQAYSACAADVNGDAQLDIFVACYGNNFVQSPTNSRDAEPDLLFLSRKDGTYEESAAKAGVADPGFGFACCFLDADNDGRPDLYIVNDFGPHFLFRNKGDATFEDVTRKSGVEDLGFGMGVALIDSDRRGLLDIYVSNMYSTAGNRILSRTKELPEAERLKLLKMAQGNSLLRNNGDGTFKDVAVEKSCNKAGWAWAPVVLDYNDDGWPDIFVANGYMSGRSRKDT